MINGLHAIVYTNDAEADRAFFRDVLKFPAIDSGGGWLIFAMPPAELACHPIHHGEPDPAAAREGWHEVYLMCDNVAETVATLTGRGVRFNEPVTDQGWGLLTTLTTPGGTVIGLYEPKHPTVHGS